MYHISRGMRGKCEGMTKIPDPFMFTLPECVHSFFLTRFYRIHAYFISCLLLVTYISLFPSPYLSLSLYLSIQNLCLSISLSFQSMKIRQKQAGIYITL